jgi:tight adherence protein C
LVAVLRSGLVDGDRLAADLLRVAVDGRDLRRRRAEEQARRIPVRLLLPLVSCSLPAFAVLSIVPIVAGTLDGLRFPTVPD